MKNTGTLKVTTPTDREIVLTRVFDAPRQLVWDAFTKPELLRRWFGPRGHSLPVCDVDLRAGGGDAPAAQHRVEHPQQVEIEPVRVHRRIPARNPAHPAHQFDK